MPRAIASLTLSFGLVAIPVKLFSATETSSAVRFKLMRADGSRVRQQYVAEATADEPREPPALTATSGAKAFASEDGDGPAPQNVRPIRPEYVSRQPEPEMDEPAPSVVERDEIVKAYEFEKGKFVLFTPDELKALREASRQTVDIVSFVPQDTIDPVYYDKAYLLAPEKPGSKPYSLLHEALRTSGRCALAKWAWRSKQYVVQVRAVERGLMLQQLRYAEEVRAVRDLNIKLVPVSAAELQLALRLIDQISEDAFDPSQFVDEEKQRILEAVQKKIAGEEIVAPEHAEPSRAEVIDLMAALRASLNETSKAKAPKEAAARVAKGSMQRKPAARAVKTVEASTRKRSAARK